MTIKISFMNYMKRARVMLRVGFQKFEVVFFLANFEFFKGPQATKQDRCEAKNF